jgi:hypothetical protein
MGRKDMRGGAGVAAPTMEGDLALVLGKDSRGLHVLRRRAAGAPVEVGVLSPLVEGKAITSEVVSLRARPDLPFVCDVKVELRGPGAADDAEPGSGASQTEGPVQVTSDAYRKGWDEIFGRRRARARDLN